MRTPLPLLVLVLPSLLGGCASSPWEREALYTQSGFVLYREQQVIDDQQVPLGYRHPVAVSTETMRTILSRLAYRTDPFVGESKNQLLFTPEEATEFAEPLSLALGGLRPDDRLRFLVIRQRWINAIRGQRAISGAMFCQEEGRLEIAFDRLIEKVQLGDDGNPEDVGFPDEPTEYVETSEPLLPFAGAVLHVDGETAQTFERWLVVTLAEVKPPEEKPPAKKPEDAGESAAEPKGREAPQPGEDDAYEKLRKQVETLKRLRSDGVISEEEYRAEFEKLMETMAR